MRSSSSSEAGTLVQARPAAANLAASKKTWWQKCAARKDKKIDTRVIWMSDVARGQKGASQISKGGQKTIRAEKVLEKCAVSALAARAISNGCDTSVPSRN